MFRNRSGIIKCALSIISLLCCQLQLYAQGENNIWVFGHDAGLNFNSGTAVAIEKHIGADEGCASVSNENGQLLFYCIGTTVWNTNGQIMPNGSNLVGYSAIGSSQGAVIVPVVNSPSRYYVFSLEEMEDVAANSAACRLSYSVIDMTLNGGLGDVVSGQKGISLDTGLGEEMTAISGIDCNVWLLVHSRNTNQFKAYEINSNGISTAPIQSITGNLHGPTSYLSGVIKVSPQNNKIALCSAGNQTGGVAGATGAELYDFDPATGTVSNAITLDSTDLCYGAAFSADNKKLYINGDQYQVHGEFVAQYDISQSTATAIINSKAYIYNNVYSGFIEITDMRLGPDGKIYMNAAGSLDYMDVINSPDQAGAASNYAPAAIHLVTNTTTDKGITNVYAVPVAKDTTYTKDTICLSPGDSLVLHATAGYYFWDWNDSTTDSVKTIKQAGTYGVRSKTYCEVHIDSFFVKTFNLSFSLGNDTTICVLPFTLDGPQITGASYQWQDGSDKQDYPVQQTGVYSLTVGDQGCRYSDTVSVTYINLQRSLTDTVFCNSQPVALTLNANVPDGAEALWSTGAASSSISVTDTGTYIVTVTEDQCKITDTATVRTEYCDCIATFPTAFTPNGDDENDLFRLIVVPACPISGYELQIYNRWGQVIFISTNPEQGWDGTFKGTKADIGTYMYQVSFQAGSIGKLHKQKGAVTLIR